ncbi:MAG TPA: ABC transporter substrate-binding protein [Methanomassiliicoccaceae archaeon]|nr:ABC transporter substrate-binding protein [Methanomassiliicoccaceae archaeon]
MHKNVMLAVVLAIVVIMASLAVAIMLLGGPGASEEVAKFTIMDDRGKKIGFPDYPQRIVSLGSSFTEIIIALNEGDRLVGVDYSGYSLDGLPESVVNLEKTSPLSMETLMDLEPDCVIIWNFRMYQDLIADMEKRGLKVVALYPKSVNDTLSTMEHIGKILGTDASSLVDELQARVNAVLEKTNDLPDEERKKVFLVLASYGGQTAGNRTISNELIEMAGGRNIFGDKVGNFKPYKEEVLKREPDVIVVENSPLGDNKYFNDLYGDTEIVNPDQIYRIDSGMLTTSPRLVEALEQLAKWLHPELFP